MLAGPLPEIPKASTRMVTLPDERGSVTKYSFLIVTRHHDSILDVYSPFAKSKYTIFNTEVHPRVHVP